MIAYLKGQILKMAKSSSTPQRRLFHTSTETMLVNTQEQQAIELFIQSSAKMHLIFTDAALCAAFIFKTLLA